MSGGLPGVLLLRRSHRASVVGFMENPPGGRLRWSLDTGLRLYWICGEATRLESFYPTVSRRDGRHRLWHFQLRPNRQQLEYLRGPRNRTTPLGFRHHLLPRRGHCAPVVALNGEFAARETPIVDPRSGLAAPRGSSLPQPQFERSFIHRSSSSVVVQPGPRVPPSRPMPPSTAPARDSYFHDFAVSSPLGLVIVATWVIRSSPTPGLAEFGSVSPEPQASRMAPW